MIRNQMWKIKKTKPYICRKSFLEKVQRQMYGFDFPPFFGHVLYLTINNKKFGSNYHLKIHFISNTEHFKNNFIYTRNTGHIDIFVTCRNAHFVPWLISRTILSIVHTCHISDQWCGELHVTQKCVFEKCSMINLFFLRGVYLDNTRGKTSHQYTVSKNVQKRARVKKKTFAPSFSKK